MDFETKCFLIILFVTLSYNCVNCSENSNSMRKILQLNKYYYNNCPNREKEWMTQCDLDAANDWNIYEGQQVSLFRNNCRVRV